VRRGDFVVILVADDGATLEKLRHLTACPCPTGSNMPADILTANGAVPSAPIPRSARACDQIRNRVPQVAIDWALANPGRIVGWNQLVNAGAPESPYNRRQRLLSLGNVNVPHHPLYNDLVYKAECP